MTSQNLYDRKFAMQSPSYSNAQSPMFRLNIPQSDIALNFPSPPQKKSAILTHKNSTTSFNSNDRSNPWPVVKFVVVTQVFVISILALMVFGLLYWSWRLSSNVHYYYKASEPYVQEAANRGLNIIRNAENSSVALDNVIAHAKTMTTTSVPLMLNTINNTAGMVTRMRNLVYNPTIRMSLE